MADPCKADFGVPEAQGIQGRETLATLRLLSRGFGSLAALLRFVANTVFNLQVLADAAPFVTDQKTKVVKVTPDTPTPIYSNDSGTYLALYVEAESYLAGSTVIDTLLALDLDKDACTFGGAKRRKAGAFPGVTLWVPPNTKLFARVLDSSGGTQATFNVNVTPVPLRGTGAYFGSGDV